MNRGEAIAVRHPVLAPDTIRQSLLTLFDSCQYAAYLSVLLDGSEPSHPLFRGRAFHETVHRCIQALLSTGEVRIASDDAKAVMVEVLNDHPEWVVPAYAEDELRVAVHRWAQFFELPSSTAATEHPFTLHIEGETLTGTIDMMWRDGDTLHLRDWKAGWGTYTQAEVSGKDRDTKEPRGARAAQLITYTLLVADGAPDTPLPFSLKGVNRFDCRFVFPMMGGADRWLERPVVITRPELIEHRLWLRRNVRSFSSRFEAQRFTAVQSSVSCSRCPDRGRCPLKSSTQTTGPFERPARDAAEDLSFLETDAKELRDEVRLYVKKYGPVPVGVDQEYAMKATATGARLELRKKEAA